LQQSIFKEEQETLKEKIVQYKKCIEDTQLLRDSLPGLYHSQPMLLAELSAQTNNHLFHLERGVGKPYFARIDFEEDGFEKIAQCYIGKIGVVDENQETVTVDWRAPVATLYYDSNPGKVSYQAPGGTISGELLLKRQLEIENGILLSVNDVETVTNDDLLKPYLSAGSDNRLKNIVASIQGEQNRIIREQIDRNLIVQGAAGSGKTTVALHRIAYLVYNHRDTIKSGQYMVIGPNRFFISYISSILPDLDVDSVPEHTFETLCQEYVAENFDLTDVSGRLTEVVNGTYQSGIDRFKTTLRYRDALATFMDRFDQKVVPDKDFVIRGFRILSCNMIKDTYAKVDFSLNTTVQARVSQCILYLSSYIDNHREALKERLNEHFKEELLKGRGSAELDKQKKDRAAILKELENGCRQSLKKHFSITETKILKLYELFLQSCEEDLPDDFPEKNKLKADTLAGLRKKKLDFTDLPALMYLKLRMKGSDRYELFRHTVIDEAQDFGEFHFYVLRSLLSQSTYTIVGDLAQSIYSYRSIESWESVREQAFDSKADIVEMRKSYRTTVEIMTAANQVSSLLGLAEALPVIRHGAPVKYTTCAASQQPDLVCRLVREYTKQSFKTIAVICKTAQQSTDMNLSLRQLGIEAEDVTSDTEGYQGGVCTITGYLSKGLEFDAVIICGVSEPVYASASKVDMHLLYVSMTRPLHSLDILYEGELTKALQE